jgi:hypothetical protein
MPTIISDGKRKVFKFSLKPIAKKSFGRIFDLPFLQRRQQPNGGQRPTALAKRNLEKSDKILALAPWILTGTASVSHIHRLSG